MSEKKASNTSPNSAGSKPQARPYSAKAPRLRQQATTLANKAWATPTFERCATTGACQNSTVTGRGSKSRSNRPLCTLPSGNCASVAPCACLTNAARLASKSGSISSISHMATSAAMA